MHRDCMGYLYDTSVLERAGITVRSDRAPKDRNQRDLEEAIGKGKGKGKGKKN